MRSSLGIRDHNSFLGVMAAACSPVEEKLNPRSFVLLLLRFQPSTAYLAACKGFLFFFFVYPKLTDRGASRGRFVWFLYACEFDELSDSVNLYTLLSSGKKVATCG